MLAARAIRSRPIPRQTTNHQRNYAHSNSYNIKSKERSNNFMRVNDAYYNLQYVKHIQLTSEVATLRIANTEAVYGGDIYDRCKDKNLCFARNSREYLDIQRYLETIKDAI